MKTLTKTCSLTAVTLALLLAALSADAQTTGRRAVRRQSGVTGVELGLEGSLQVARGGQLRWLVTAYEVVGLQQIRPALEATVSLTTSLDPAEVAAEATTDQYGRAVLEMAVPEDAPSSFRAVLRLRSASEIQRRFELTVTVDDPRELQLHAARQQVRPGGIVRVFGRLQHGSSGGPLPQDSIELTLRDQQGRPLRPSQRVVTDRAGLFAHSFRLRPEDQQMVAVRARAGDDEHSIERQVTVRIVEPQAPPMLLALEPEAVVIRSSQRIAVPLALRTGTGRPVTGAVVTLDGVDEDEPGRRSTTDRRGRAELSWQAPRLTSGFTDHVIRVTAVHERLGRVTSSTRVRVAASDWAAALSVEGGALVPELGGRVWVRTTGIDGLPARAGVPVQLRGPRLEGSPLRAETDESGIATFEVELTDAPAGASDRCGGDNAAAIEVTVGAGARRAGDLDACLPLDPDATARVRVGPPLSTPSGQVRVEVARAPVARGLPVSVALLAQRSGRLVALGARVLDGDEDALELELPSEVSGQVVVRARPLHGDERQEVRGGSALIWVAPGRPQEARVELIADHERAVLGFDGAAEGERSAYVIGLPIDEADQLRQRLRAGSLGPLGDLRRAPAEASEALLTAALAAAVPRDAGAPAILRAGEGVVPVPAPENPVALGLLRDPWRSRARFVTGRLALIFRAIEQQVAQALPERIDDVAVREGRGWRFNSEILEAIAEADTLSGEGATGLGGAPLTIDQLQDFDRAFTYNNVARRITRERLFHLYLALRQLVQTNGFDLPWSRLGDPAEWLRALPGQMVTGAGSLRREELVDGWGRPFVLRRARGGRSRFTFVDPLGGWELVSTGPDGRAGTGDDLWDPTARVLPRGSAYAEAVGEDVLVARLGGVELGRATIDMLQSSVSVFRGPVRGVPRRPESATEGLIHQLWHQLPSPIERRPDALALRRPDEPGDGAAGEVFTLPAEGGSVPLELDEEPRTWGVVVWAWTRQGFPAVAGDSATAGAPLLVEADLPRWIRQGESVTVPLQVTNLTTEARQLQLSARTDGPLEAQTPARLALEAEASDSSELVIEGQEIGRGSIELNLADAQGEVLRSLIIPVRVETARMPVRLRAGAALTARRWRTELELPSDAESAAGRVVVLTPSGLSGDPDLAELREDDPALLAWAATLNGRALSAAQRAALDRAQRPDGMVQGREVALATACGVIAWSALGADDEEATRALRSARSALPGTPPISDDDPTAMTVRTASAVLAALAPGGVAEVEGGIHDARDPVALYAAQMRLSLRRTIHVAPEEPSLLARAAAALLLADPRDGHGRAMLDRALDHLEEGEAGSLVAPSERRDSRVEALTATLALAIAAHQVGRDEIAGELLRGAMASENVLTRIGGELTFWMLAAAAYGAMGTGTPERVTVDTGEGEQVVDLASGRAVIPIEGVRAGRSRTLTVEREGGPGLLVRAEVVMGRGFESRDQGPLALEIQGDVGDQGELAALELSVTADRPVPSTVLEIQLPSGIDARNQLVDLLTASGTVRRAEPRRPGFIQVHLGPLAEGAVQVIPLPLHWTVSGDLRGLGVIAYPATEPSAMTVLAPRDLPIH